MTEDFDLRFDDRVLMFHCYVNTDRENEPLAKKVQRIAKGPRLDASVMWLEGYGDGREAWAEMCRERDIKNDFTLRYGNRVIAFHLIVNTDADPYHIHKRILALARGDKLDACVCWTELAEGADGRAIWGEIQKLVVKAHADPKSRPYSLGGT